MKQYSDNRIGRFIISLLLIAISVFWLFLFLQTTKPVESAPLNQSNTGNTATPTAYPTATETLTPTITNTPTTAPVSTSTPQATVLYSDGYEPNNTLADSFSIVPGEAATCGSTLWPSGDEDYYRYYAREGFSYTVTTSNVSNGLDTTIKLYDPSGRSFTNDENAISRTSEKTFLALESGYFYVRVKNQDGSDPAGKTYCVEVDELQPTVTPTTTASPTATGTVAPTSTPSFTVDTCEVDDTLTDACLMGRNETKSNMNFVPNDSWKEDRDWYALYVTQGIEYTCETTNLSSVADTVINMYARDGNPLFIGNDNRALGDFSSKASWYPNYTGWIYILVESAVPVAYEESSRYTYDFSCSFAAPTETPTPTETPIPTNTPVPTNTPIPTSTLAPTTTPLPTATMRPTEPALPTATARPNLPTATRIPTQRALPTATPRPQLPTSTPIAVNGYDTQVNATETPVEIAIAQLPTNTPQPPKSQIQFSALPTPTQQTASAQDVLNLTVTLYYDENVNYQPEINEGIMDVSVALYDSISGQLLAFGYTNEAGIVPFEDVRASGAVRISIPFLSYTQVLASGTESAEIRIAPQPRPIALP